MLILTRRVGESLIIDDHIEVKILGFRGNNEMSIGVEAPKSIKVLRDEIYRIEQDKKKSA